MIKLLPFHPQAAGSEGYFISHGVPYVTLQNLIAVDLEAAPQMRGMLRRLSDWVLNFLEAPHADLGRRGAICPFVKKARLERLIYVTGVMGDAFDESELTHHFKTLMGVFEESAGGASPAHRCLLILFPDLSVEQADGLFNAILARLRHDFVSRRLMLGEFHQGPPEKRGLHNPDFKPLYAPFPLMAIRPIGVQDIAFLRGDEELEAMYNRYFPPVAAIA